MKGLTVIHHFGCKAHCLIREFCTAAAVENFGGSLQNVVVVPASLHSSELKAFDLFTVYLCKSLFHI